jgi:hypothetical protein
MAIRLIYLEDAGGNIELPPSLAAARAALALAKYAHFELREANTIAEVESLERRLRAKVKADAEIEIAGDEARCAAERQRIRSNLQAAIASAATDQYTKDYLRAWIALRDQKRREKYKSTFQQREAYFEALHYDRPRAFDERNHEG